MIDGTPLCLTTCGLGLIVRTDDDGSEIVTNILLPGDVFDYVEEPFEIINGTSDFTFIEIPYPCSRQLYYETELRKREIEFVRRRKKAVDRLLGFIDFMTKYYSPHRTVFDMPFYRIASLLSLTPQHFSKTMNELRRQNVIDIVLGDATQGFALRRTGVAIDT